MDKRYKLLGAMLIGLLIGNIIGFGCSSAGVVVWLGYNMTFGLTTPVTVDLGAITTTFGLQIYISVGGIGTILATLIHNYVVSEK